MKKKKSSTSASSKNLVETHCISSLPYVPKPISHIVPVHNQDQSWLLVARDSGEIEIYTVDQGEVFLERVLPGGKNKAISSMVGAKLLLKEDTLPFSKPTFSTSSRSNTTYKPTLAQSVRLFTGSLNGTITEWNLDTLVPKFTMDVCVSGVWSLAVNHASTQLAVGGDDGSLFVYDIISPCYTTPILLPLVGQWRYPNHRLLHITYHPTMNAVYACTDDSKVLHFPLSNLPIRHVEVSGPVGMPLTKKKKKKNLKNKTSSTSVQEKSSTKITCWCSTWCYEDDRRTPLLVVGTSVGSVVIVQMDTFTLLHTLSVSPTFVDVIQVSNLGTLVYAATLDGKVTVLQRGGDPLGFQVVQTRQWQAHDLKALTVMSVPYLSPLDPLGNPKNQKATVMRPWLVTGGVDSFLHVGDLTKSASSLDKVMVDRKLDFGATRISIVTPKTLHETPFSPVTIFVRLDHQVQLYHFYPSTSPSSSSSSSSSSTSNSLVFSEDQPVLSDSFMDDPSSTTSTPLLSCIAKLQFPTTSTLVDMAVSSDGQWIAVTHSLTHVFRVHPPKFIPLHYRFASLRSLCFADRCSTASTSTACENVDVAVDVQKEDPLRPCNEVVFAGYDPMTQSVHVFGLSKTHLTVLGVIPCTTYVTHLSLAHFGPYLVIGDVHARMTVYLISKSEPLQENPLTSSLQKLDWITLENFPLWHVGFTSMSSLLICNQASFFRCFQVSNPRGLVCTYQGPSMTVPYLTEVYQGRFLAWHGHQCMHVQLPSTAYPLTSLSSKKKRSLNDSIQLDPSTENDKDQDRLSLMSNSKSRVAMATVTRLEGFSGLLMVVPWRRSTSNATSSLSSALSLVMVLRPFDQIMQALPPTIFKKKFGKH